ncbi:HD-GYP domain-containing protein [Salinimonas sediminis]|uniref:HD-GYP domain-containing protein n=1 Tax=Salinimonas sediminis TaxID=2303538 RepID=A0A346NHA6_9ALTE|nr:HD-GYP domain-containing protein [Salinimonas sediminis]AXR04913.1 HD-GYP domain-containing protein [Salinimonas sediminis]
MNGNSLKTITIDQLVPGMFVSQIVGQSGGVKIKSEGKVTSQKVVDVLRARGVKKLVIDPNRAFTVAPPDTPNAEDPEEARAEKKAKVPFFREIQRAEQLHAQGKEIQKSLLESVQKGLPFDDKIPRAFSHKLVESIDRNPDALLCLTKIREKDDYLLEHSLNVAILLANFGQFVGMDEQQVSDLAYAGFLHDMGKIRIPDNILHKLGRLTDPEMAVMKRHVEFGVDALHAARIDSALIRVVSEHHERLDGKGYPAGIGGQDISQEGRMLAIADMYDALTADRCYKAGMPSQKAMKILLQDAPERLDSGLVQQFIKCMGVYPVGSLVRLSTDKLAMVLQQNDSPLTPVVKVFYSVKGGHFLEPKDIDLACDKRITIESSVLASEYKIDFNSFFERSIAL